jgi:hypothetical protein
MAYTDSAVTKIPPPRRRKRNSISANESEEIAKRVTKFWDDEWINRHGSREARKQRYAKYRLWSEGTDWPWDDAADIAIPDMLQDSLRVQDTLVNAVMSQRPPVVAKSNHKDGEIKQPTIDQLLNFQFFVENMGELTVGEMAEAFVNDPVCTVYTPWVREKRKVGTVLIFDEIPPDEEAAAYFFKIVRNEFPAARSIDAKAGGWDWTVIDAKGKEKTVCFYTDPAEQVEMVVEEDAIVFDGPRPFVKDYDDVAYPGRSANLQMPSPSNPNGAPYVILRDKPTLAELKRLKKSGFYDLPSKHEMDRLANVAGTETANPKEESQQQKDDLAGTSAAATKPLDTAHKRLTRLVCFDTYDIDGDGIEEDVVFWVIYETKTLLKVRLLSDLYPGNPPRRPLDGASFLPVGGRYDGMSLLETMESMHDAVKILADQSLNANDLAICSPGFYRPAGGMNPEVLKISPFTLSPLQNPQQDVTFPPIGNPQGVAAAMNLISIFGMWQDKLTMVTDHSFGQVAPGSSSALRTTGNMALVSGQNEARPERILRRFFLMLTGVWTQMHRLNQSFLPKGKQFRIAGVTLPGSDPYIKVQDSAAISGTFQFTFDANVLNTSKASLQSALQQIMGALLTPLFVQAGVVKPDNMYRMALDYGRAFGQDISAYISTATPQADMPRILAEQAILQIMNTQMPFGLPAEAGGVQEHIEKMTEFAKSDEFGHLQPGQLPIFKTYMQHLGVLAQQEQQQQQLQQNAAQFQQQRSAGGNAGKPGGGAPPSIPPSGPPQQPPQISGPGELMNESLPGAGGGANQ